MSCSSDDQSDKECPLCMEQLELDDVDFYPCKCEYQICRFCWHRIRTNENGLCPACRQPYPEDPVNFKPLSSADLQRIKDEKKMKQQAEKLRISESRKHLANYRVLQKNLVYVVGLSQRFASEDTLRKPEYFGRFGKIVKVVTGTSPSLPHLQGGSHTAYVTYSKVEEALRAIQSVNNAQLDGRIVKASLGTTKYCSAYLRYQVCMKPDCMYLHDTAESEISFTKEDMHMGKHTDYERKLIDTVLNRRTAQSSEKRQPTWSNRNICWEQNGNSNGTSSDDSNGMGGGDGSMESELVVEDPTPSEAFRNNSSRSSSKTGRRNSQDKENQTDQRTASTETQRTDSANGAALNGKTRTPPPSEPVPPPSPPREPTPPPMGLDDAELTDIEEAPSISAAPAAAAPSESKLLRLMQMGLSEPESVRGSVPAPAPREEGPAPLMNWQSLLGLAPPSASAQPNGKSKHLTGPPPGLSCLFTDDDLGFDPFNESTKGLAQLLEEERVRHPKQNLDSWGRTAATRDLWGRPPGMGHDPFSAAQREHQPARQEQSLHSSVFDMFGLPTQTNNGFPNGLHHHSGNSNGYSDYGSHTHSNGHHHSSHHANSFAAPPGLAPLSQSRSSHLSSQSSQLPQSITEWQEGLKALLPNVNVRFASDMEQQPSTQQQQQQSEMARWQNGGHHHHSSLLANQAVPPPPGFSLPNR